MDGNFRVTPKVGEKKKSGKSFFIPFEISSVPPKELKEEIKKVMRVNKEKKKKLPFKDENIYFIIKLSDKYSTPSIYEGLIKNKISIVSVKDNRTLKIAVTKENIVKLEKVISQKRPFITEFKAEETSEKLSRGIKDILEDKKESKEPVKVFIELSSDDIEGAKVFIDGISKMAGKKDNILHYSVGQKLSFVTADFSRPTISLLAGNMDAINRIETRPEVKLSARPTVRLMSSLKESPEDDSENADLPIACVIDSGINKNHPLLSPFLEGTYDFFSGDCSDSIGHGTMVASRIIYPHGVEPKGRIPFCKVIMVKAFKAGSEFFGSMPQVVEEAVNRFLDKTNVFNLSFAYEEMIEGETESFRKFIDIMAAEKNVLFLTAAGNIPDAFLKVELERSKYPFYLPRYELLPPANCYNCLSVGSLTNTDTEIAPKNAISPFSKVNSPNLPFTKPEVFYFGGNLGGSKLGEKEKQGVVGCSHLNNNMSLDIGTSFAVPPITSLAAELYRRYPDSPNHLIKAMIINSCSMSRGLSDGSLDKRWYGFGKPSFDAALGKIKNKVTYFCSTRIGPKQIHVYEVYGPTNANNLVITLAHNRNPKELEYCDFEVKIRKGGVKSNASNPTYCDSKKEDNVKYYTHSYIRGGRGIWEVHVTPKPKLYVHGQDFDYSIVISFISTDGKEVLSEAIEKYNAS